MGCKLVVLLLIGVTLLNLSLAQTTAPAVNPQLANQFLQALSALSGSTGSVAAPQATYSCTPCEYNVKPCCSPQVCRKGYFKNECKEMYEGLYG